MQWGKGDLPGKMGGARRVKLEALAHDFRPQPSRKARTRGWRDRRRKQESRVLVI